MRKRLPGRARALSKRRLESGSSYPRRGALLRSTRGRGKVCSKRFPRHAPQPQPSLLVRIGSRRDCSFMGQPCAPRAYAGGRLIPSRREQSSADAVTSLLLSDSCASGAGQVETAPFVEEQKSGEARARTLLSQESGRARAVCQLGPSRRPDVAAPPKRRPPAPLIVTQLPGLFSQRRAGAPRRREGRRRAAPPPRERCGRPARASRR